MYSGWKYNLNVVKDIKVTDDFMKFEEKGCGEETYENCTTRTFLEKIADKCGCLSFSINFNNSKATDIFEIFLLNTFAGQNLPSRESEISKKYTSF